MCKMMIIDLDALKFTIDKNATIKIERNKSEDQISIVTEGVILVVSEYSDKILYNNVMYTMTDAFINVKKMIKELL